MQDRKLLQDDNRGLDQGVMDNKPTLTMFRLFVEQRKENCVLQPEDGYLSVGMYLSLNSLNYPLHHLVWAGDPRVELKNKYSAITTKQDIGIHLVSLSTIMYPDIAAGVVLHRVNVDECFVTDIDYQLNNNGQVSVLSLFIISVIISVFIYLLCSNRCSHRPTSVYEIIYKSVEANCILMFIHFFFSRNIFSWKCLIGMS